MMKPEPRFKVASSRGVGRALVSLGVATVLGAAAAIPAGAQSPSVTDLSRVDAQIIESGDIVEALAVPRGTKVRANARPRIRLPVYFEFNSTHLKPEATTLLRKVGKALSTTDLESFHFLIEGHTDAVGSEDFNASLSKRRAEAVQRFLEGEGVSGDRLQSVGRGESDPVDDNVIAAGRKHNRRIEIINLGSES